jgi:hypothetical protein
MKHIPVVLILLPTTPLGNDGAGERNISRLRATFGMSGKLGLL